MRTAGLKIMLFVFGLLLTLIHRVLIENKVTVKRNVVLNWVFSGSALLLFLVNMFVPFKISQVLFVAGLVVLAVTYVLVGRGVRSSVVQTILDSGLVLNAVPAEPVDILSVLDGPGGTEEPFDKGKGKSHVKHSLNTEVKSGKIIPTFMHTFVFPLSSVGNSKQYEELVERLQDALPEYHWGWVRDGKNAVVMAWIPCKGADEVRYADMRSLSKALPWYVIPLAGAAGPTNLVRANTCHMLKLHDVPQTQPVLTDLNPKVKGKKPPKLSPTLSYPELLQTRELQGNMSIRNPKSAGHALVVGKTGHLDVLNSMIAHFVDRGGVDMYVLDTQDEDSLQMLNAIPQVVTVATNVETSYEVIKRFLVAMSQRYHTVNTMGMKGLPLGGDVHLGSRIAIDGNVFNQNEKVHVRIAGDERDVEAQDVQPGMEVVIPGDRAFRVPNHWRFALAQNIQYGQQLHYNPMVLIVHGYKDLVKGGAGAVDNREITGSASDGRVDEAVMIQEIRLALDVISRMGRRVNVHLIALDDSLDESVLPVELRDHLDERITLSDTDVDSVKMLMGEAMRTWGAPGDDELLVHMSNSGLTYRGYYLKEGIFELLGHAGVDGKRIASIKKGNIPQKDPLTPLRFDRYEAVVPSEMPEGVEASYGIVGESTEKVRRIKDGSTVEVGGRKIVVNRSAKVEEVKLNLSGLYDEDKQVGSALLPEVPDMDVVRQDDQPKSLEEILQAESEEREALAEPRPVDEGRIDEIGDGIRIVGDKTSLNSIYSASVGDDGDEFTIVK